MKTKEEFWNENCFITDEGYCINKEDFFAYASQFQSTERVSEADLLQLTDMIRRNRKDIWKLTNEAIVGTFLERPLSTPSEQEAIAFAEWVSENYHRIESEELDKWGWVNFREETILVHGSDYHYTTLLREAGKTTEQLYQLFKSAK